MKKVSKESFDIAEHVTPSAIKVALYSFWRGNFAMMIVAVKQIGGNRLNSLRARAVSVRYKIINLNCAECKYYAKNTIKCYLKCITVIQQKNLASSLQPYKDLEPFVKAMTFLFIGNLCQSLDRTLPEGRLHQETWSVPS